MQKQQKSLKIKGYSRSFIKFDLSNFEISCSVELSTKKSFISTGAYLYLEEPKTGISGKGLNIFLTNRQKINTCKGDKCFPLVIKILIQQLKTRRNILCNLALVNNSLRGLNNLGKIFPI